MRRCAIALVWGVLVTGLASCDAVGLGTGPEDELQDNLDRWTELAPTSYTYAVSRLCFCGAEAIGPVRITVEDGTVTERVYVETGDPVSGTFAELFPTVDGLFEVLADAYERDAAQIDVTYDPETGVPLDFWIDYQVNIADEELGFRVTEPPESSP